MVNFYPRSPRGERHEYQTQVVQLAQISIHAPREGSDQPQSKHPLFELISIHAPREGSDPVRDSSSLSTTAFLSTLPARGATEYGRSKAAQLQISIHAPREGSDPQTYFSFRQNGVDFYPRSPRGERHPP